MHLCSIKKNVYPRWVFGEKIFLSRKNSLNNYGFGLDDSGITSFLYVNMKRQQSSGHNKLLQESEREVSQINEKYHSYWLWETVDSLYNCIYCN